MAKNVTLLTTDGSGTTASSRTTAAVNPASTSAIALLVGFRSADLASVASEVFSVSGCASSWNEIQRKDFDSSNRMAGALFIGTGPFTNEAITLKFVSDRSCDRGAWIVAELDGTDGSVVVVQSNSIAHGLEATDISVTLSSFAHPNNWAVGLAMGQSAAFAFGMETGYETPLTVSTSGVPKIAAAKMGEDTTITMTRSGQMRAAQFAFEYATLGTNRSSFRTTNGTKPFSITNSPATGKRIIITN